MSPRSRFTNHAGATFFHRCSRLSSNLPFVKPVLRRSPGVPPGTREERRPHNNELPGRPNDSPRCFRKAEAAAQRSQRWQNLLHNVSALKTAGIRLGVGTDAGVTGTHHGWATLRELQLLVAGGLSPAQAITAATFDSARALRVDNERGSVAAGKVADLVLVSGAPHQNISDIERIARVFLGGREIDREVLGAPDRVEGTDAD